ncbi:MAG: potassium channel family protein [Nanoarchaeota archaeon]
MAETIFLERSSFRLRIVMLTVTVSLLLVIGTFFYHFVEHWSYIDSFYFSAISLSTRGYGELHPSTAGSKLFTVFYLFFGVAFILYMLSSCISYFLQYQEPKVRKKVDSLVKSIIPPKKDKWVVVGTPRRKETELELPEGVKRR